jgi:hypothetical protein
MARSNFFGSDLARDLDEPSKLQLRVTGDARNWSATREIIFDERAHDGALEFFFEVEHVKRESQFASHTSSVINIVKRAAARRLRLAIRA